MKRGQRALEIVHKPAFAPLRNAVPLVGKTLFQLLNAAGILRIQLAARLQRAPLRRDPFCTRHRCFRRRMGRDP